MSNIGGILTSFSALPVFLKPDNFSEYCTELKKLIDSKCMLNYLPMHSPRNKSDSWLPLDGVAMNVKCALCNFSH